MYPVSLMRSGSDVNADLELFLYHNRLQLAAKNALYSDGDQYTPAVVSVDHFKTFLPFAKNVLVLGTGLGSIVEIIRKKGYTPDFTLLEFDKVILKWAMEFLPAGHGGKVTPVCMDAMSFMRQNNVAFDFIFIDIFEDLSVPVFVYSPEFLQLCRKSLSPGGHIAFNYIPANEPEERRVQHIFTEIFPGCKILKTDTNRIFVL